MEPEPGASMSLWVIGVIGLLTFGIRAVFVLGPKFGAVERAQPWLMALPIAVMPILAASAFGSQEFSVPKVMGLVVCGAIGVTTRKTALAMGGGIVTFWALQWLGQSIVG